MVACRSPAEGVVSQVPGGNRDRTEKCRNAFADFAEYFVTEARRQDKDCETDEAEEGNHLVLVFPAPH